MIRPPMEFPGGRKNEQEQQDEAVLLEDRPPLPRQARRQEGEQHLRAVERRDRDQVEDHQHEVDVDEEVSRTWMTMDRDLDGQSSGLARM